MENDKKKKKNKKKKNNQVKAPEDVKTANAGGEMASGDSALDQNHRNQIYEGTVRQIAGDSGCDMMLDRGQTSAGDAKAVILEEKVRQIEVEKNSCILREVILEDKVKQLESEKDTCIQREVILQEKAERLECEKNYFIQREAGLEKKVRDLEDEKDFWIKREVSLKTEIEQLLNEKASWSLKQVSFETEIEQLLNEKASWSLKETSLAARTKQLESDKEFWVLKEKLTEETVAKLNEHNMGLQLEVKVLLESRDGLLQEYQHLMESMSVLQSKVQHLEKESTSHTSSTEIEKVHPLPNDDTKVQIEAARSLVDKLMMENAELVEKVNELYIELNKRSIPAVHSSKAESDQVILLSETTIPHNNMPELSEKLESVEIMESPTFLQTKDSNTSLDHTNGHATMVERISTADSSGSYESGETDEIVQIPLDESDIGEVELQQSAKPDDRSGISLADAPLTGAPFRMISFFARYVSGADLVKKSTSSSTQ